MFERFIIFEKQQLFDFSDKKNRNQSELLLLFKKHFAVQLITVIIAGFFKRKEIK